MSGLSQLSSTFINDRFCGREEELKVLSGEISNFSNSETSLLLIEGPAGIGKTSLVQKVLEGYRKEKCFMLYGKYENQQENAPYRAIKQAFKDWANQILLLNDEELNEIKEAATSALQTNITAVTSVFAELEVFFSRKQLVRNTSYQADPIQIKARFYYFFKKFLKSITATGNHLIIFMDDLQWADRASILLLEELVRKNEVPNLIFVATYRPLEKGSFHFEKIKNFKQLGNSAYWLLKPLPKHSVDLMIPDQWNFSPQNADAFKKYLWHETHGNPLKIKEILKTVQREKLHTPHAEEDVQFWENLPKYSKEKGSVAFIKDQLARLPEHQIKLISTASCLGFSFTSEQLETAMNLSNSEIVYDLSEITAKDFLIKKDKIYVFAHDTILSAANSFLSVEEKCVLHQKTGLDQLSRLQHYNQHGFFSAVNHLNRAWQLLEVKSIYSAEHILLNIHAARLAIKSSALEIAFRYFGFAEELLKESGITKIDIQDPKLKEQFETDSLENGDLKFQVLFGFAETMFLSQKLDLALEYTNRVFKLNTTRHQRILATKIKLSICSALIHQKDIRPILLDGYESLEKVLREAGIIFPEDPQQILLEASQGCKILYEKTLTYDEDMDFSKLINPDKEYQDLLNLIMTSMTFLYYMDVKKNLYVAIKALLMCVEKGYSPMVPVLFSASFLISPISEENRNLAHFLGNLSIKMIEKEPFKRYTHVIYYIATLNFYTWKYHYRTCIEKLEMSVQLAEEAGDPHYASFCSTDVRVLNTYSGKNLKDHLAYCEELEKKHPHIYFISSSDNQLSYYLTGQKPGFSEGNFEFPEELVRESGYNMSSRFHMLLVLEQLYYLSGNNNRALKAGRECNELKNVYAGFQIELEHFLFYSLILLKEAFLNPETFTDAMNIVEPKLGEFRRLSAYRSGNFYHKVLLLEAEIAKCEGNFERATFLYDEAILEAKNNSFIHHAAIAAELAFEYYLIKGRKKLAQTYFNKAIKFYTSWGAKAKVEKLKTDYPELVKEKKTRDTSPQPAIPYDIIKNIISRTAPGQKVELAELGDYLISQLVSHANARKGNILVLRENIWKVLAASGYENDRMMADNSITQLQNELPVKLLNYSIKKGTNYSWINAAKEPLFSDETYLQKIKAGRIVTYPVKQNSETVGLIYLEDVKISTEEEQALFSVIIELVCTTLANALYYENNDLLNRELKLQERKKIEAIIESQEKERQRIATELHDSLGQVLALTKLNVSQLSTDEHSATDNGNLITKISDLVDESCSEVRTISYNLMPPDLDRKSISEILENLVKKNSGSGGTDYNFEAFGISNELSVAFKFTLYRILQEIIHNITKHASASKVTINLSQTDDFVYLLVEDNGKGFDKNLVNLGLGLKNIHSRIKLLNGYLDADSSINNGTVFNVSIPLKP